MSFPYLAKTTLKYKSPHATDLSFAKDEMIRVTGASGQDEDWLMGETLDGSKSGGFPKDFVVQIEDEASVEPAEKARQEPQATSSDAVEGVEESEDPPPLPTTNPSPPEPVPAPAQLPPSISASPAPPSQSPPSRSKPPPTTTGSTGDADSPSRPQSMKDRLAFFNAAQTKAAPPPIKPKPATSGGLTWSQKQKLRAEQEAKEKETGGGNVEPSGTATTPSVSAPAPAPVAPAEDTAQENEQAKHVMEGREGKDGKGMSVADATSSITKGGSLKDRMAALQGAGAFGQAAPEKPTPPKPGGKVWSRPAAPPEPEPEEDGAAETVERVKPTEDNDVGPSAPVEGQKAEEVEGDVEGQTEEEEEKARRAAIAARMAKLGARGPIGMALPAKPTRRPTKEAASPSPSPTVEKAEPTPMNKAQSAAEESSEPVVITNKATPEQTKDAAKPDSPPASVPIPAMPRRTAPPRRRGAAPTATPASPGEEAQEASTNKVERDASLKLDPPEPEKRFETVDEVGRISPPPQVMVANEERPLPKTRKELEAEKEAEEWGRGPDGREGAEAAGIALMNVGDDDEHDRGQDIDRDEVGGPEEEDAHFSPPRPVEMVPLHPPAEAGNETAGVEDELPPPPPPRLSGLTVGKDEVELKHEHDAESRDAESEEPVDAEPVVKEEEPTPATPSKHARMSSLDRPLPSPGKQAVPSSPNAPHQPRDPTERDLAKDEPSMPPEEESAPSPPPRRKPSMPAPLQIGVSTPASPGVSEAPSTGDMQISTSPLSPPTRTPQIASESPTSAARPSRPPPPSEELPAEGDDDQVRRSGIAARMAKLGGVKFGMPPPKRKPSTAGETPASPGVGADQEIPLSPTDKEPPLPSPRPQMKSPGLPEGTQKAGLVEAEEGVETPEAETERRRATLARLRAGGALGFGMFNHGPAKQEQVDERRLQEDVDEAETGEPGSAPEAEVEEEEEEAPPPPPPVRPPVPSGRPMPLVPDEATMAQSPPPPPMTPSTEGLPPPVPMSMSGMRPAAPTTAETRPSQSRMSTEASRTPQSHGPQPSSGSADWSMTDEPAVMMMNQDTVSLSQQRPWQAPAPSPPPGRPQDPGAQGSAMGMSTPPTSPHRTTSSMSRGSRISTDAPTPPGFSPSRQSTRRQSTDPGRTSMSQARPGFNELQAASRDVGGRVIRAAKGMFEQSKKAYYGDGSPAGFVLMVHDNAHLSRPEGNWGQVVHEQEAGSILKRYDEPRPGDIAAFHDARFKGRKGLQSYDQHVGSVQDALVGIVADYEPKNKHKLRVLQVERGVPEEISYRFDDLKSGKVVVYRPGI